MSVDVAGVGSVADLVSNVIDKIWPDKSDQEKQAMANAFAVVQGQLEVNKIEAANPSIFVSGWRPYIGWVCGAALTYQFVLKPFIQFGFMAAGQPIADMPGIDNNLWELMFGMLGFGGLRTFEKTKGIAKK